MVAKRCVAKFGCAEPHIWALHGRQAIESKQLAAAAPTTRLSRDAGRALLQLLEPPACLERCAEGL